MKVDVTAHGTAWPPVFCVRFAEPPTVEQLGEIESHLRTTLKFIEGLVASANGGFLAFFSLNALHCTGIATSVMENEVKRVLAELPD
jgi:hypothetical protein